MGIGWLKVLNLGAGWDSSSPQDALYLIERGSRWDAAVDANLGAWTAAMWGGW